MVLFLLSLSMFKHYLVIYHSGIHFPICWYLIQFYLWNSFQLMSSHWLEQDIENFFDNFNNFDNFRTILTTFLTTYEQPLKFKCSKNPRYANIQVENVCNF